MRAWLEDHWLGGGAGGDGAARFLNGVKTQQPQPRQLLAVL